MLNAIVVWNNTIIDGYNRFKICTEHDIAYCTTSMDFDNRQDVIVWMLENQLGRRNLTEGQRYQLASSLAEIVAEQGKQNQREAGKQYGEGHPKEELCLNLDKALEPIDTLQFVADQTGISRAKAAQYRKVEKEAPDLFADVLDQKISVSKAHQEVKKKQRREERANKIVQITKDNRELNAGLGQFNVIYADPPWRYEHSKTDNRQIENQSVRVTL